MRVQHPDFTSKENTQTLIVFGLVGDPARVFKRFVETAAPVPPLTSHYVIVSASIDGVRLSSPGWMRLNLNQRLALDTSDDLFTLCSQRLLQNTPPFSGPVRLFLKAYLEFAKAEIVSNKDKLEPPGQKPELFTCQDYVFSAWLPFPEARILLPPHYDKDGPAFAETSVAFRTNGRIIAVLIDGAGTALPSDQTKIDYLRENHPHLDLIHVHIDELRSGRFPAKKFPESFVRFWHGIELPMGPCPPAIEFADDEGTVAI